MRHLLALALLTCVTTLAAGQGDDARRFGLRFNKDLYPQDTPKAALGSVMRALDKDRYDYLVAQLLDPDFVEEQMRITYPVYEKVAREQVQREGLDRKGFDATFIRKRINDLATQANFEYLTRRIRTKLDDDPEAAKELRRMFRDGEFNESGETTVVRLKDVKDRALYLRRVGDRWFIQNKMIEDKPGN